MERTGPLDEQVYEKLRLDGEIVERIAPLVIKERYLREQEYVRTEQLAQAGLRTPGEVRVVKRKAWEQGIAEGVRQGLFGSGALEDERPVCRYYNEEAFVGLAGSEVIVRAVVCQAQQAAAVRPGIETPVVSRGPPIKETGTAVTGATPAKITGVQPARGRRLQRLRLEFTVPKGKVSGLMGVMNLLQHKFDRLDVVLAVGEGVISEQEYEDKTLEAFRQLGIEVVEQ